MSTKNENLINVIGFIGIDVYDILFYLSRTLLHINKKILIIDKSDLKSLSMCVNVPSKLNIDRDIIDYRGVDCTSAMINIQHQIQKYDYIFIYFGMKTEDLEIKLCSRLFLVTDLQLHHTECLKKISYKEDRKYLVIRNGVKSKVQPEAILKALRVYEYNYFYLQSDMADEELKLSVMYDNVFVFKRISKELKELLMYILIQVLELQKKEILKAYKIAERGK